MKIFKSITQIQKNIKTLKYNGKRIGFVPTMGALHQGHLSLIKKAKKECDICIVSIFVNPIQFGPQEDLKNYPRDINKDILLLKDLSVDLIFVPDVKSMYSDNFLTSVFVDKLSSILCGKSRPTHFKGVTTVVTKLLNITMPDILYIGQKDGQQAAIISKMISDLNFNIKVKICPTIREKDGLAMSSRNTYLTESQRIQAANLYKTLQHGKKLFNIGNTNPKTLTTKLKEFIKEISEIRIEYIEIIDLETLQPITKTSKKIMIAIAGKLGNTRLIDNIIIKK